MVASNPITGLPSQFIACANCEAWRQSSQSPNQFVCMRYPPDGGLKADNTVINLYPPVGASDGCYDGIPHAQLTPPWPGPPT